MKDESLENDGKVDITVKIISDEEFKLIDENKAFSDNDEIILSETLYKQVEEAAKIENISVEEMLVTILTQFVESKITGRQDK